jgi:DNA (cytosine-5)-methyltransferase 1
MNNSFTAIDLFAGIGGFRLAIEKNGGKCINFSEIAPDAIKTYCENFPDAEGTNLGDITKIKMLPRHDLLTGGVPCQSWSIAGRNLGFDDDRGQLWNDSIYLLNQSKPKTFIFENVKGLSDPRNKQALDYIMLRIKEAGYHANVHVLNSFDYGVPQSRVRIYIIGFKEKRFLDAFRLPEKTEPEDRITLADILDGYVKTTDGYKGERDLFGQPIHSTKSSPTSLSRNNNGFNDYFLFNDLRNGSTTIHSWELEETTEKEKHICLLLLRNRRKSIYGCLDGNPLSIAHFKALDSKITEEDIRKLVDKKILKEEEYAYKVIGNRSTNLDEAEALVLGESKNNILIFDELTRERKFKIKKIKISDVLKSLERKGLIKCIETRFDFRNTKISTGLFGINRVFLPSSNIFPTLVASDSNDFVTTIGLSALNEKQYKKEFIEKVFNKKAYRKITVTEACKIQGFPANFKLPPTRARWMKLIGNSVSVPVIEKLVGAICNTGVFTCLAHD